MPEKSINNNRSILSDDFHLNIEKKISDLNILKGEYLQFKSEIHKVLKKEYNEISLNDSFKDLRSYQLWDKFQSKDDENWNWIKDEVTLEVINDFVKLKSELETYKQLYSFDNLILKSIDFDIKSIFEKINDFNFTEYLNRKSEIEKLKSHLDIDDISKISLKEGAGFSLIDKVELNDIKINKFDLEILKKYFKKNGN